MNGDQNSSHMEPDEPHFGPERRRLVMNGVQIEGNDHHQVDWPAGALPPVTGDKVQVLDPEGVTLCMGEAVFRFPAAGNDGAQ